jgi:membrane protease YdiL (CAAX protease family)
LLDLDRGTLKRYPDHIEIPSVTRLSPDAHARALLGLIAALLVLWTIWSTQILPLLPRAEGVVHTLQSVGVRLLLWGLPCGIYLWRKRGRQAFRGLRLELPPTWRHAFVAVVIVVLASFAVSLDVARKLAVPPSEVWARCFESIGSAFPTGELLEELTFRSVLLSELLALWGADSSEGLTQASRRRRAWLANIAASTVFVGLHWPWWIFTLGLGERFLVNSAGVFLLSLVLGILFIASRSVWPCVVLHAVNNALSSLTG